MAEFEKHGEIPTCTHEGCKVNFIHHHVETGKPTTIPCPLNSGDPCEHRLGPESAVRPRDPRLLLTETGCKVTVRRQKAEDTAPPAGVYLRLSVEDMDHSVRVAEVRLNEIEAVELATCLLEVLR